jgi:hypothetical protein
MRERKYARCSNGEDGFMLMSECVKGSDGKDNVRHPPLPSAGGGKDFREADRPAGRGAYGNKERMIGKGGWLPGKMVLSPANVSIGIQKACRGEFAEPVSLVPIHPEVDRDQMAWLI